MIIPNITFLSNAMSPTKKHKNTSPVQFRPFTWPAKLDRLLIFNPARWPHRELVSRLAAVGIIAVFLGLRIDQFNLFPQSFQDAERFYGTFKSATGQPIYSAVQISVLWGVKLAVWLIESAIYLGYIAAYTSRARAVQIARGFMETAFPVIVAGLPVLISLMPYSLPRWAPYTSPWHLNFYLGITTLILIGGLINLIGLLTLRRAFTIMSEARELITHGLFRYMRHPLYTGHFIMFLGSLLLRLHPVTIGIYLLFLVGQAVRATIEERKLKEAFPRYGAYQRRTGMFFPRIRSS
jgi:protein-S-isoprenylcysteine O-methyltransferase Ste14